MLERSRKDVLLIAALIGITLALYLPRIGNSFVDWDLEAYKPVLFTTDYHGTAWELITDLKGSVVSGYYAPLSSLSLMMDKWLVGSPVPVPRVTLLINLLIHCLNGVIVFALIRLLGIGSSIAAMATFVFLLHPIQVPSVLWFAQRKGLLAGTCYLAAYLAYVRHRQSHGSTAYGVCLALFIAGLLAKPTVVTLPVALLLTELILPDALRTGEGRVPDAPAIPKRAGVWRKALGPLLPRELVRLAPFFIIAVGFGLVTLQTERVSAQGLPILERPVIAASAIWFYLRKIALPINLSPLYPRWNVEVSSLLWWIPTVSLCVGLIVIVIYRERIGDRMVWGLANFITPLLPVIGLFKFAYLDLSYTGDHLVYLAMMGISLCISLLAFGLVSRIHRPLRYAAATLVAGYFAFYAVQTVRQAGIWENSVILWTHNLRHNPNDWRSHNALGHALLQAGQADRSVEHFRKTLELRRKQAAASYDDAVRLARSGAKDRAEQRFAVARKLKENLARTYYNLGMALWKSGNIPEAIGNFELAVRQKPGFDRALNNLGAVYLLSGRVPAAIEHLRQAVTVNPGNVDAHCNLGIALLQAGKLPQAIEEFREAVRLKPDFAKALKDLGGAYLMAGKPSEAVSSLKKAVEINPDDPEAHRELGAAWKQLGDRSLAEIHFRKAKGLGRGHPGSTRPDGQEERR